MVRPERRAAQRRQPGEHTWFASARLRPGRVVRVVNLSCRGALLEAGSRLLPGARVVLQFQGPGAEVQVPSRVLRCHVEALDGRHGIRYRGAVVFEHSLDLVRADHPEPG